MQAGSAIISLRSNGTLYSVNRHQRKKRKALSGKTLRWVAIRKIERRQTVRDD